MLTYEEQIRKNHKWGFLEGSMHFDRNNAVHRSMEKIVRKLQELNVPYAVVGAMAMFYHGHERFTTDVDILVSRQGLQTIHQRLEGLGYLPPFEGSKHLRDTETGVRIEFLVSGDYPGDGKPKPIAFPEPEQASVEIEGIRFLQLPRLVELKIASGMTNAGRLKDLGDVQEMIRVIGLPRDFSEQLNPFVREKYQELWDGVQQDLREP